MRDANEKVLGMDYSWMDAPAKAASAAPAQSSQIAQSR